jgi:hypothetical protein
MAKSNITLTSTVDDAQVPLEYLSSPCWRGSESSGAIVVAGRDRTYQWPEVTTNQDFLTTTYTDVNGSVISYLPPAGTGTVIYRFCFSNSWYDNDPILHFRFYIDSVEVTSARITTRGNQKRQHRDVFEWPVTIAGSLNGSIGQLTDWNTFKTLKLQARAYGTSNQGSLHLARDWNGAEGTAVFSMPHLTIIALKA